MKITNAKKTAGAKYPFVAHTRFSFEELEQVKANAAKTNLSVCAFLRHKALGLPIKSKVESHEMSKAINFLSQVSGLVKKLHKDGESCELVPFTLLDDIALAIRHVSSIKIVPVQAIGNLEDVGREVVAAHKNKQLNSELVEKWRTAIKQVGSV